MVSSSTHSALDLMKKNWRYTAMMEPHACGSFPYSSMAAATRLDKGCATDGPLAGDDR